MNLCPREEFQTDSLLDHVRGKSNQEKCLYRVVTQQRIDQGRGGPRTDSPRIDSTWGTVYIYVRKRGGRREVAGQICKQEKGICINTSFHSQINVMEFEEEITLLYVSIRRILLTSITHKSDLTQQEAYFFYKQ